MNVEKEFVKMMAEECEGLSPVEVLEHLRKHNLLRISRVRGYYVRRRVSMLRDEGKSRKEAVHLVADEMCTTFQCVANYLCARP